MAPPRFVVPLLRRAPSTAELWTPPVGPHARVEGRLGTASPVRAQPPDDLVEAGARRSRPRWWAGRVPDRRECAGRVPDQREWAGRVPGRRECAGRVPGRRERAGRRAGGERGAGGRGRAGAGRAGTVGTGEGGAGAGRSAEGGGGGVRWTDDERETENRRTNDWRTGGGRDRGRRNGRTLGRPGTRCPCRSGRRRRALDGCRAFRHGRVSLGRADGPLHGRCVGAPDRHRHPVDVPGRRGRIDQVPQRLEEPRVLVGAERAAEGVQTRDGGLVAERPLQSGEATPVGRPGGCSGRPVGRRSLRGPPLVA